MSETSHDPPRDRCGCSSDPVSSQHRGQPVRFDHQIEVVQQESDRLGFTKYEKAGDGHYEKRAGKGPDTLSAD